jgi:hypothetical protein
MQKHKDNDDKENHQRSTLNRRSTTLTARHRKAQNCAYKNMANE